MGKAEGKKRKRSQRLKVDLYKIWGRTRKVSKKLGLVSGRNFFFLAK